MSSEAWLIRKAKKGDTKAYGELIQLHKDYFLPECILLCKKCRSGGRCFPGSRYHRDAFHQRSEKSELFPHMDDTHYL